MSEDRLLFDQAPISLWEEDYSQVKSFLDGVRRQGVTDLRAYLDGCPEAIQECMARIHVLDVNRKTLEMFGAASKEDLMAHTDAIFRDEMSKHFREELVDMWEGRLTYEREGVNYALNGDPVDVHLCWTVLPGYEATFGRVLVSLLDITARKRAERYLQYLGTHDVLTGLYNRAYFEDERNRAEAKCAYPISIIIMDLDGLKAVNDRDGHAAGDDLLRRAGEVLKSTFLPSDVVARIGGDEFAVLLPHTDPRSTDVYVEQLRKLINLNNAYYQAPLLSFSIGCATGKEGASLVRVQKEADDRMYAEKRQKYGAKVPA